MRIFRHLIPLSVASLALAAPMIAMPTTSYAQIGISITLAPPPLPIYAQPPLPELGYIWTPGYWAWGDEGYYWVPGTWILPPQAGLLWTPGYWAWRDSRYFWNAGYWGPHVGFYGGINYGYGYTGSGYYGGRWDHDHFRYNSAANNFGSRHVTNVYRQTINVSNATHVSFNGGRGGLRAQPRAAELSAARDQHVPANSQQAQHERAAAGNRALLSSVNRGRPPVAATSHPAEFSGAGTVRARGAARTPDAATPRAAAPADQRQPRAAAPAARPNVATPAERPRDATPQRTQPQRAARPPAQQQPQQRQAAPQRQPAPAAIAPRLQRAAPQPHQEARPHQERPQPAARPAPAARPEPAARPAPAARPEPARGPEENHDAPERGRDRH
jgi:hypothetical protein